MVGDLGSSREQLGQRHLEMINS
ncbi:MAG: hypothetical protein RLZZ499_1388, partial [Cyanobacteriota bacterium]